MAYADFYADFQQKRKDSAAEAAAKRETGKNKYKQTPLSAFWAKEGVGGTGASREGFGQFGGGYNPDGSSKKVTAPGFGSYLRGSVEPPVVKDAAYYMNLATQGLGGVDYSGLRTRAQESVSGADERVKAMYRAMREIQAEEAATREASRNEATQSITSSADQAAADIAQGYNNALSSLAAEMADLGVEQAIAQEPAQRIAAESGRNQAVSRQLGQISGNLNTQMGQADSAFNQQTRDITGLEGADFRSTMQNDLLNRLAELDAAQQQQNQQLPMQRLQYAQDLRGYDQSFEPQGLSFAEQLQLQQLAADSTLSLAQRQDEMFRFFMDKKGMDPATASQAVNDYFTGPTQ
jgi:hypothetical protein